MNFLEPLGLIGLAALVPIVALYFLKLKREQRVVPSTLLWKQVIEDLHVNAPFQRLRYSLLLLLQLLLVALLGFALARPFLAAPAVEGKRLILLVDTSASMGTRDAGPDGKRTRLEQAVLDAEAKIDDLGGNGEARIVTFDQEVGSSINFTSDRNYLKNELRKLQPRDLSTNAQEAFETALTLAGERENTEILVLSDGSFPKLSMQKLLGEEYKKLEAKNTEDVELVKESLLSTKLNKFRFVPYGKSDSDNVGITGISARSEMNIASDADGNKIEMLETDVFITVENFAPKDVEVILTLSTEVQTFPPKVIKLKARASTEPSLNEDEPSGRTLESSRYQQLWKLRGVTGVVTATITSPADAFPLDNTARVVVGQASGTKVLLVSKPHHFLETALAALQEIGEITVEKMEPDAFLADFEKRGQAAVEAYDCVLFNECAPPMWNDGGAIFLGQLPPVAGFKLVKPEPAKMPEVIDWDNTDPVMRYITFRNVTIAEGNVWEVPKTAKVLVEGTAGPLIASFETDRVHVVASSFKTLDSDWPLRTAFSLFQKNAIYWTSLVSPRRRPTAMHSGEPLPIPPVGTAPSAELVRPSGKKEQVTLSPERTTYVKNSFECGIYKLTGLPGGPEMERTYAVNLADARESDNAARDNLLIGNQEVKATPNAIEAKREIWRWLVLAAVGFLLAEWFVYHRRVGL